MEKPQKPSLKEAMPSKRPPAALFIWLIIFIFIASLVALRVNPSSEVEEWAQSRFEKQIVSGNVISAKITPETERILYIEGKFKKKLPIPVSSSEKGKAAVPEELSQGDYSTKVLFSENLDNLFKQHPEIKMEINNSQTWWKSLLVTVIIPVLIIVGLLYFLFSRQLKMAGKGAMQFGKSRARMIFPEEHKTRFDDVAGADEAKEETKEIVDYLKDPLKYKMVGGKIPKGALLMGPPGTGKTLMAKAVAGEAEVPFFAISGSDFVEMFVGVGASRVRDMFEQARKHSPCLIFIDEIDAVGRSRFSGIGGGHDEREQTLNALLVEMDGLETQEGVIILAATNRPDVLDPALLRPGRFDRQIVLDLPDIRGRRQILDVHVKTIRAETDIDLNRVAKATPGFSGADLANLVNEAALLAARDNRERAGMPDFEEARDKVRWGRERRSRKISERERKLTAYHEAGHALVEILCPDAMPVHKVTIIPRGQAYLGATMHLPDEDRYTHSRKELLDQIRGLMGGRVAEEIIFGDVTSGASQDIKEATRIARTMVCALGMDDKMGVVQYGERADHIYLGRDITREESYSEVTAREIDIAIKSIIDACKSDTFRILTENKDKLEKLAIELLEKETLDGKEIKELLDIPLSENEKEERLEEGKRKSNAVAAAAKEPDKKEPDNKPEDQQKKSNSPIINIKA